MAVFCGTQVGRLLFYIDCLAGIPWHANTATQTCVRDIHPHTPTRYMQVLSPNHYLVVDHAYQSVVLSICGTSNFVDLVTDMVAEAGPFLDGRCMAHSGIATSAQNVLEKIGPELKALLLEHPTYKLVLTGHSLGGGTAVLATCLLLHERRTGTGPGILPEGRVVECFAYAPPPVLSVTSLSEVGLDEDSGCIKVFINNKDWIPTLSISSLYRLTQQLLALRRLPLTFSERVKIIGFRNFGAVKGGKDALADFLADDVAHKPHPDFCPMYHPGQIYHAVPDIHPSGGNDMVALAQDDNKQSFQEIRVGGSMMVDHLQNFHERVFQELRRVNSIPVDMKLESINGIPVRNPVVS